MHPAACLGGTYNSIVPIMFTSGSDDDMVKPKIPQGKYDKTTGVPKVFAEKTGVGHSWIATDAEQWSTYSIYFFNCYLLKDETSCEAIYGSSTSDPCSLCNCETCTMTVCETDENPTVSFMPNRSFL